MPPGYNQAFGYPPPHSYHHHAGPIFPGQSPPFQSNNGGYFAGMGSNNESQIMATAVPVPLPSKSGSTRAAAVTAGVAGVAGVAVAAAETTQQPLVITHLPPGASYATVPYPHHNHYPTGQPLLQHTDGRFYPAIMHVISSDSKPDDDAILLTRIVEDPPIVPESWLLQPKKWIRWTETEDLALKRAVKLYGEDRLEFIAKNIFYNTRDKEQCKQRWKKALQPGLIKGKWKKEEDAIILQMVKTATVLQDGSGGSESLTKWSDIAKRLPGRIGEDVKARYVNHLDPTLRKGVWTKTEMDILIEAQKELGNRWAEIARRIPGRSENSVKNRWYNAKTSEKRKASKLADEEENRKQVLEIEERIEERRRTSAESSDSLIFKSEEDDEEEEVCCSWASN